MMGKKEFLFQVDFQDRLKNMQLPHVQEGQKSYVYEAENTEP
jgi:hypothetical protein